MALKDRLTSDQELTALKKIIAAIIFWLFLFLAIIIIFLVQDFRSWVLRLPEMLASEDAKGVAFWLGIIFVGGIFYFGIRPLVATDSAFESAKPASQELETSSTLVEVRNQLEKLKDSTSDRIALGLKKTTEEITRKIEESVTKSADLSDIDGLFQAGRQRLINESSRIDRISRRNLYFGIVFSGFALTFLAWPLVAQTIYPALHNEDISRWIAQSYLPRIAVGLLLQFVGFFFLRLYVANENDLKHNRNELTNIEAKMMALQLSKTADTASKKEVIKTLLKTERNFTLKRNERTISADVNEYNDIKALLERLVSKLPGVKG